MFWVYWRIKELFVQHCAPHGHSLDTFGIQSRPALWFAICNNLKLNHDRFQIEPKSNHMHSNQSVVVKWNRQKWFNPDLHKITNLDLPLTAAKYTLHLKKERKNKQTKKETKTDPYDIPEQPHHNKPVINNFLQGYQQQEMKFQE